MLATPPKRNNIPKSFYNNYLNAYSDAIITYKLFRKKYPNAKIAGWIKELWVGPPYDYEHPNHKARIDFLNQCDVVVSNRPELNTFPQ